MMKTLELNIGDDALREIKRALTVAKIAQSGSNPLFISIAQRILDAAQNDESVTLLTAIDKQEIFDQLEVTE